MEAQRTIEAKSFADLYRNPIKVDKIKKFSRDELHERQNNPGRSKKHITSLSGTVI